MRTYKINTFAVLIFLAASCFAEDQSYTSLDGRRSLISPAVGSIIHKFQNPNYTAIGIAGSDGDPIFAVADGKVVFAGAGLKGYGNLIIIRHDVNLITAYGHNRRLLVREDDVVKKGQQIAEMGSTDSNEINLRFEVRFKGVAVDPETWLNKDLDSNQESMREPIVPKNLNASVEKAYEKKESPIVKNEATATKLSLEEASKKCEDLGFKKGTERFGKCVLTISR